MLREGAVTVIPKKMPIRIEDGAVPMTFKYPRANDTGRIGFLSKQLLWEYSSLGQIIRFRHIKKLAYNRMLHKEFESRDYLLEETYKIISGTNDDIEKRVCRIIDLIGEIDAVDGPASFDIPDELKPYLAGRCTKYQVPSKSFWYLAEPPHYINEQYPVTDGEKNSYGFLAYCINRTKYYAECGHTEKLIEFQEHVRSCYIRLRKHIIQSMPTELSAEVDKIMSANQKYERRLQPKRYEVVQDPNLQLNWYQGEEEENSESLLCVSDSEKQNDDMKQKLEGEQSSRMDEVRRKAKAKEVLQQELQKLELEQQEDKLKVLKWEQELELEAKDKPAKQKKGNSYRKRRKENMDEQQQEKRLEENDKAAQQNQKNENCKMQKEDNRNIKKMTTSERQELPKKKLKEKDKAACP